MTMLQTFDLVGNKQSFAEWISNLSPCETPFISMIPKEGIDQVQYSWQTDSLSKPENTGTQEGSGASFAKPGVTKVHTNFTQIYRKAVRVSDTTKKISLYGRASELAYQMEKAGMEIKRDLEHAVLNTMEAGRPGTAGAHGIAAGVQKLVAAKDAVDPDTGAKVHKVVTFTAPAAGAEAVKFTQLQVFDMTYQLYLAGARADKVMVHPSNMYLFSDWIGSNVVTPHVHRMFDGMDNKFNVHVSKFRDPLGQEFEIIPNRYMPVNQLFFFNAADWTQMILRSPEKVELAKNGSAEKHMIEMEVGLRHRNPFASAILEFNVTAKTVVKGVKSAPTNILGDNTVESTVSVIVTKADGTEATAGETVALTATAVNDDGSTDAAAAITAGVPAKDSTVGSPTKDQWVSTSKVKHPKGARLKIKVEGTAAGNAVETVVDTFEKRD